MKKILITLFLIVATLFGYSQTIVNRAQPGYTVSDARLQAQFNLYGPRYNDTTAANVQIGIDSCGALIYTRSPQAIWYRQCSPKRWIMMLDSLNVATIINNLQDSSVTNISIVNDSTLLICNASGTCSQFHIVTNITNINTVSFITDSSVQVCTVDSTGGVVTSVCDTVIIGRQPIVYLANNWLRLTTPNQFEFGSPVPYQSPGLFLNHTTYANTGYNRMFYDGFSVYNAPYEFSQQQSFQNGTSVIAFKSAGDALNGYPNNVRMILNFTSDTIIRSPFAEGYFGRAIGYSLGANWRGVGPYGTYLDNNNSKTPGIFYHLFDTTTTDGVTVYAAPPLGGTPPVFNGLLKNYRILGAKTNKSIQYYGYDSVSAFISSDTLNKKPLAVDANGNQYRMINWPGGTVTTQAFPDIATLQASDYYTNSGNLIALMQGYNAAGDGSNNSFYWDGTSSATEDGVFVIKPTAVSGSGRWLKIFNGVVRAIDAGIKTDGTDQTSALNTLFSNVSVKEVLFDNGNVSITGKVDGQGKTISFQNNAQIIGAVGSADTLTNALITADYRVQIFDTLLTTTSLSPTSSAFSLIWFGGKADAKYLGPTPTDNRTPLQNAITASTGNSSKAKIYLPGYANDAIIGYYYSFGGTVTIGTTTKVELFGDGFNKTVLTFPHDQNGFKLLCQQSTISNMKIRGGYSSAYPTINSDSAHGIWVAGGGNVLNQVWVSAFDGDGFRIEGDVNFGTNANLNKILDCYATGNGRCGIYLRGGDANANTVATFYTAGNARWGIWDKSFLGNYFYNAHSASNVADHNYNKSLVVDGGYYYECILDNTNVQPGVATSWDTAWYRIGAVGSFFPPFYSAWNDTTTWISGGGYLADGYNQYSIYASCYNEGDNIAINKSNAIFEGGFASFLNNDGSWMRGYSNGVASRKWIALTDTSTLRIEMDGYLEYMGFFNPQTSLSIGWSYDSTNKLMNSWQQSVPGAFQILSNATTGTYLGRTNAADLGAARFKSAPYFNDNAGNSKYVGVRTAAPTTGRYEVGDIFINSAPTTSSAFGWRCTTAGTPGVWETITLGGGGITSAVDSIWRTPGKDSIQFSINSVYYSILDSTGGSASYIFSTGLNNASGTITANLSTGVSGGQTLIGGTGVGDIITYKGTTANGTSTVAAHTFTVGNNGATTAFQIYNSGVVAINNPATPSALGDALVIKQPDNGNYTGIRIRSNNELAYAEYGYAGMKSSSAINIDGGATTLFKLSGTQYMSVSSGGVGIGNTNASGAWLHVTQPSTTSTAPARFEITGSVLTTTPLAGALEVLADSLYYTGSSVVRRRIQMAIIPYNGLTKVGVDSMKIGGTGTENTNIDWGAFTFTNTFNSISGNGLSLTSTSTAAAGNAQKLLNISLSGANATASQSTYGIYVSNSHSGTTNHNYGVYAITSNENGSSIAIYGEGNAAAGVGGVSQSGFGVSGTSTSNLGVYGLSGSFYGVQGTSSSSFGIYGQSTSGIAIGGNVQPTSTNTVVTSMELSRTTSGTAADGIGQSINLQNKTTTTSRVANQIISKWTTATDATRTSQFIITGVNSGTTGDILTLNGNKSIQLNGYGALTFSGTPNYILRVDASGNVKEGMDSYVASGGSSAYTVNVSDKFIDIDATSTTRAVNLPALSNYPALNTYEYIIKKTDSSGNTVVVTPNGAETIEGAANVTLSTQYKYVRIYAAGTMWKISGSN